jgi:hypothetical protein
MSFGSSPNKTGAISVIGFCRPVNTLASLIGVAKGKVQAETRTQEMASDMVGLNDVNLGSFKLGTAFVQLTTTSKNK